LTEATRLREQIILKSNLLLGLILIFFARSPIPAAAQSSSQPSGEGQPVFGSSQNLKPPISVGAETRANEAPDLGDQQSSTSGAEVKSALINQVGTGDGHGVAAPLKTVINANAEMKVDPGEKLLKGLRGLAIEVKNNTDRPLIFHGDQASAVLLSETFACASKAELEKLANPMSTGRKRVESDFVHSVAAGATLGVVPTTKGIVRQSGPVLTRYGWDERRRQDEVARFGDRVVWPGRSTKGIIYFDCDRPLSGAAIQMPVSSLFDTSDQASIIHAH
jgi:hypothetical protein